MASRHMASRHMRQRSSVKLLDSQDTEMGVVPVFTDPQAKTVSFSNKYFTFSTNGVVDWFTGYPDKVELWIGSQALQTGGMEDCHLKIW
jgi:hypothetical protein